MQDTIYCFHLLATRQKSTLLYAMCSIPVVTAIWLLNPEWPFWAGYIAWALVCTAVLMIQYAGHAQFPLNQKAVFPSATIVTGRVQRCNADT